MLRVVARDGSIDARRGAVERARDDFGSKMRGEHDLRPVAGRAVACERVVADEIGGPLHAAGIDIDEQRGVAGHDDQVAVAFEAGEPRRIGKRCFEVGRGVAFARGPLTDKDLRALAVGGVVVVRFAE